MVAPALVEPQIEAGRELVRRIDLEADFFVVAALWLLVEETEWRLIIASPFVDQRGSREGYRRIQKLLDDTKSSLDLRSIGLVGPHETLIELLASVIDTGTDLGGIRFSRNTLDGLYIEDAYLYRVDAKSIRGRARRRQTTKGNA